MCKFFLQSLIITSQLETSTKTHTHQQQHKHQQTNTSTNTSTNNKKSILHNYFFTFLSSAVSAKSSKTSPDMSVAPPPSPVATPPTRLFLLELSGLFPLDEELLLDNMCRRATPTTLAPLTTPFRTIPAAPPMEVGGLESEFPPTFSPSSNILICVFFHSVLLFAR